MSAHARLADLYAQKPVVLAPMEDVTDIVFRRLCRQHGATVCMTEFVNVEQLLHGARTARRKVALAADDALTGIQIYGADPERLAAAAQIAEASGPLFIDINCGCWVPKIAGRGAGAGWLRNPAAMVAMARLCATMSPRPDLVFGAVSISPHTLQWSVVGFGIFVIVNLLQGLSLSDKPTFAVISGSPTLIMVMAVGALQSVINYGIMGFTPSFLMKTYALSMKDTALTFGLLSAALGIIGPMISGPVSDVLNRKFPGRGRSYVTLFALGVSPFVAMWVYTAPSSGDFYLRFSIYSIILTG
mgnify:CR=1 FL=1